MSSPDSVVDWPMFALFTSHGALRRVAARLRDDLDPRWPLLVQGQGGRDQLLRRFREAGNGILLGTDSFWEGVDVPGRALRTLVLATYLLGVTRVLIMPHTDCRMTQDDEAAIHEMISEQHGVDTQSLEFRTVSDQRGALASDVARIRSFPYLPKELVVGGAIYDVHTGTLEPIDC